jgi:hypothetical protein
MTARHWLRDIGLAILLALSLVAFARPQVPVRGAATTPAAAKLAVADRVPGDGRISLLG